MSNENLPSNTNNLGENDTEEGTASGNQKGSRAEREATREVNPNQQLVYTMRQQNEALLDYMQQIGNLKTASYTKVRQSQPGDAEGVQRKRTLKQLRSAKRTATVTRTSVPPLIIFFLQQSCLISLKCQIQIIS